MIRLDTITTNLIRDIFNACDTKKQGYLSIEETVTLV